MTEPTDTGDESKPASTGLPIGGVITEQTSGTKPPSMTLPLGGIPVAQSGLSPGPMPPNGKPGISQQSTIADIAPRVLAGEAVKIDTPSGPVWVIGPRAHGNFNEPFDSAVKEILKPPVRRAAYSDRVAWLMAELSKLAYLNFEKDDDARHHLIRTLDAAGLVLVGTINNTQIGTQAFVVRSRGRFTALIFRGTEKNFADIRADLDARFLKTPEGRAQKGFYAAFEAVRKDIEPLLADVSEEEPLYLAGHSLGGALATVAACILHDKSVIAACYTFGSPRVGDAEWSDHIRVPIYRIVNGSDGVPLLPGGMAEVFLLRWVKYIPLVSRIAPLIDRFVQSGYVGYQHAGDIRFLSGTADACVLKTSSAATWARCVQCVMSFALGLVRFNVAKLSGYYRDHAMAQYTTKLRKIALERNS